MLPQYLQIAYRQSKQKEASDALVAKLKLLPLDDLKKLASGEVPEKLSCLSDGPSGPREWIDKFKGTPLFEQAVGIERALLEFDATQTAQRKQEQALWSQRDALNMQKRMLDLDLALLGEGGAPGPGPAAAAPAPASPIAPALNPEAKEDQGIAMLEQAQAEEAATGGGPDAAHEALEDSAIDQLQAAHGKGGEGPPAFGKGGGGAVLPPLAAGGEGGEEEEAAEGPPAGGKGGGFPGGGGAPKGLNPAFAGLAAGDEEEDEGAGGKGGGFPPKKDDAGDEGEGEGEGKKAPPFGGGGGGSKDEEGDKGGDKEGPPAEKKDEKDSDSKEDSEDKDEDKKEPPKDDKQKEAFAIAEAAGRALARAHAKEASADPEGHYVRRAILGNPVSAAVEAAPGERLNAFGEASGHHMAETLRGTGQGAVLGGGLGAAGGLALGALNRGQPLKAMGYGAAIGGGAGAVLGNVVGQLRGQFGSEASRIHGARAPHPEHEVLPEDAVKQAATVLRAVLEKHANPLAALSKGLPALGGAVAKAAPKLGPAAPLAGRVGNALTHGGVAGGATALGRSAVQAAKANPVAAAGLAGAAGGYAAGKATG